MAEINKIEEFHRFVSKKLQIVNKTENIRSDLSTLRVKSGDKSNKSVDNSVECVDKPPFLLYEQWKTAAIFHPRPENALFFRQLHELDFSA